MVDSRGVVESTIYDRDLAAPAGAGGRHPLPEAAAFGAAMRAAGVRAARAVVVYDAAAAMAAARAWWLLHYFGHPDATVLDGGAPRGARRRGPRGRVSPDRRVLRLGHHRRPHGARSG